MCGIAKRLGLSPMARTSNGTPTRRTVHVRNVDLQIGDNFPLGHRGPLRFQRVSLAPPGDHPCVYFVCSHTETVRPHTIPFSSKRRTPCGWFPTADDQGAQNDESVVVCRELWWCGGVVVVVVVVWCGVVRWCGGAVVRWCGNNHHQKGQKTTTTTTRRSKGNDHRHQRRQHKILPPPKKARAATTTDKGSTAASTHNHHLRERGQQPPPRPSRAPPARPFLRIEQHQACARLLPARPVRRVSAGSCAVLG